MQLLIENSFPSFLLGIIPVMPEESVIFVFELLKKCLELGPMDELIRFLDCKELVNLMASAGSNCFESICEIFGILCSRDMTMIERLFESRMVEEMCNKLKNGMAFMEKKAAMLLLGRIVFEERDDEILKPLLKQEIFELCLEIYGLSPDEVSGLLSTIARFHSMTFEMPELHEMLSKYVED
jgi:hypothetical protein